jgi:hypothetical protein
MSFNELNSSWFNRDLVLDKDSAQDMKKIFDLVMDLAEGRQLISEEKRFLHPI